MGSILSYYYFDYILIICCVYFQKGLWFSYKF